MGDIFTRKQGADKLFTTDLKEFSNVHLYLNTDPQKIKIMVGGVEMKGATDLKIHVDPETMSTVATITVIPAAFGTKAELEYELNSKLSNCRKEGNTDGS